MIDFDEACEAIAAAGKCMIDFEGVVGVTGCGWR